MSKLLEMFKGFYYRNYPDDMEMQVEYFAVFGGYDADIDTSKSIDVLIKEIIFSNIKSISAKMDEMVLFDTSNKKLLHAIAVGDRRIFSAFNRARLNNVDGGMALSFLEQRGIVQMEYSREEPKPRKAKQKLKKEIAKHRISHKVFFTSPFVRFWFYFVYPHLKEIQSGDLKNFFKEFRQKQNSYTSLVFEELSEILLDYYLRDAQIVSSGSYWDAKVEVDILTFMSDGNIYVAECKWTNHKINKKELHRVFEKCQKIGIEPSKVILFSKRGFSKELESMQGSSLSLYSVNDFKVLV